MHSGWNYGCRRGSTDFTTGLSTAAGDAFAVLVVAGTRNGVAACGDRSHRPSIAEDDNIHAFGNSYGGDLADEFQPVHDRHVDIAQDEGDYIALQRGQRFGPVRGFHNLFQFDARLTQRTLDYFAHHRGVIHEERSCLSHGFHHSASFTSTPPTPLPTF